MQDSWKILDKILSRILQDISSRESLTALPLHIIILYTPLCMFQAHLASFVPNPYAAFCRLQYGNLGSFLM